MGNSCSRNNEVDPLQEEATSESGDDPQLLWDPDDCSDNLVVSYDRSKVIRKDAADRTDMVRATLGFWSGVHKWEITWSRASRGTHAVIGVATTQAPLDCSGYKSLLGSNDQSLGWDIVNNKSLYNDGVNSYPANKSADYEVGDRIVVILDLDEGSISFCDGDEELGECFTGLKFFALENQALWPAISITEPGAAVEILYLTEQADDDEKMQDDEDDQQDNEDDQQEEETDDETKNTEITINSKVTEIKKGIKKTLALMKKKNSSTVEEVIEAVKENIIDVRAKLTPDKYRVMLADEIAELGGGHTIMKYLHFLSEQDLEGDNLKCYCLILSALQNATDDSRKLSVALAKNGLFKLLHDQLQLAADDQTFGPLFETCVGIVFNCAKRSENRQHLLEAELDDVLQHFLNTSNSDENTILFCYVSVMFLLPRKSVEQLTISIPLLQELVSFLELAAEVSDGGFHCAHSFGPHSDVRKHGCKLVMAVSALAQNKVARKEMADNGVFEHLVKYGEAVTDTYHQELTLTAIYTLLSRNTVSVALQVSGLLHLVEELMTSTTDSKDGVRQEATRVYEKIKTLKMSPTPCLGQIMPTNWIKKCYFASLCKKFVAGLKLDDAYFAKKKFNRCYCAKCYEAASGDQQPYRSRGQPAKDYGIPIGWYRFGLKTPPKAKAKENVAFNKYNRAYHGTNVDVVAKILSEGQLLMPGDETEDGIQIGEKDGHFEKSEKPTNHDPNQIFVSPSIRYAAHTNYAQPKNVPVGDKEYEVQVVLQVLIKPDAYKVGPETVGAETQIDPRFSNDELEWSTKRRGAVILYGLLVRVME